MGYLSSEGKLVKIALIFSVKSVTCDAIWETCQITKMQNWVYGLILMQSKLFPKFFKLCPYDIHIKSYDKMMSSSWDIIRSNISQTAVLQTSEKFSQVASHLQIFLK